MTYAQEEMIFERFKKELIFHNFCNLSYIEKLNLITSVMDNFMKHNEILTWDILDINVRDGYLELNLENSLNLYYKGMGGREWFMKIPFIELSEDWEFTKDVIDG